MSTTFEEAKQCPKCGMPGTETHTQKRTRPASEGGNFTLHFIECRTVLCNWFETSYVVQVNEDGSIPEAYSLLRGEKQYPKVSPDMEAKIIQATEQQLQAETRPNSEIRNPRS